MVYELSYLLSCHTLQPNVMTTKMITLYVLLCVSDFTHHVNAQGLNSVMQNTAAMIGDTSTSLTCGAETAFPSYVTWGVCIAAPVCVSIGYDDTLMPAYSGQYRLAATGNTGEFKLEIQNLATTGAGQYRCHASASSTSQSYAEVIALAAAPSCTWNTTDDGNQAVEGDFLHMICQVSYTGRWAPVTRWNEGLTASDETVPGLAKYSVIVEVGRVGPTYVATTSFDKPTDTGAGEADNAPDYQHIHAYPALSVDFGPHSLAVNPDQPSYYPGDTITCSASGNPAPIFKWINGTSQVASGSDLEITVDMLGFNSYRCEASNIDFRDVVHSQELANAFTVQAPPTTTTTTTTTSTTTTAITDISSTTIDGNSTGIAGAGAGSGLSGGEIGGIVVLIVVFVVSTVVVTLVALQIRVISSNKNKNQ